jgi:hypothetical protein
MMLASLRAPNQSRNAKSGLLLDSQLSGRNSNPLRGLELLAASAHGRITACVGIVAEIWLQFAGPAPLQIDPRLSLDDPRKFDAHQGPSTFLPAKLRLRQESRGQPAVELS